MRKVVGTAFFKRKAPVVARDLLGKFLVRRRGKRIEAFMLTEVEAYDGFDDRASHAARGQTERNSIMFGDAGYWYVYFVYGMHWMLNIVTGKRGYPSAVLIRGVTGVRGPAKLTKHLRITGRLNGKRAERRTGLWFEARDVRVPPRAVMCTARVGVRYAGKTWANKKWRFVYDESRCSGGLEQWR